LKGFARVTLEPGETRRVTVELERRSFAYYDTDLGEWAVTPGVFEILVGRSSQAIELRRKLTFTK
jgi:beta-glucosidase